MGTVRECARQMGTSQTAIRKIVSRLLHGTECNYEVFILSELLAGKDGRIRKRQGGV